MRWIVVRNPLGAFEMFNGFGLIDWFAQWSNTQAFVFETLAEAQEAASEVGGIPVEVEFKFGR